MEIETLPLRSENDASNRTERIRNKRVNPFIAVAVGFVVILFPLSIGFIDSVSVGKPQDMEWFQRLNKPPWMPPGWVFGVVWTILYLLMGIASYLLWFFHVRRDAKITIPVLVYGVSLILNGIWTPIFFSKGLFTLALVDIVLLFLAVLACVVLFWRIHIAPAILMMPYAAWLVVAFSLNIYIVIYNPDGKNQKAENNNLTTTTTTTLPI